jgi:hypothetical protein
VFIGTKNMDQQAIVRALDDCLLRIDSASDGSWKQLPDPFPKWGRVDVPEIAMAAS